MPNRRQRPRGTTTRELVVNAAFDVVDRVGLDSLTIRSIAGVLNAPPMSLYTHFANKEELLDLMYAELARRLYPDSGQATWQTALAAMARHVRETLLAHPHWTPLISRQAPPTPMPSRERLLKLMVDARMSAEHALQGMSAVLVSSIGLALVELTFRDADGTSTFARRFERQRSWLEKTGDPKLEPTSREAFARMHSFEFAKSFDFTLKTMIDGLELPLRSR
jgi:AcrR family transcriptional regulator